MSKPYDIKIPFPVERVTLGNGTKLLLVQRPGLLRKAALWSVPFGSTQQLLPLSGGRSEMLPAGVAHFLEHQLFREEDGSSISDSFAALGVQENAFTYFDQTGYHFRCTDNFMEALQLLLRFTAEPFFSEESVASEREIITQELLMYRDLPESVLELNQRQGLFGEHPAGEDIGGTPESIALVTPELLRRCHQTFYHPSRAVLVIIGDVDSREIQDLVGNFYAATPPLSLPDIPPPAAAIGLPCSKELRRKMFVPRPIVSLGLKEPQPLREGHLLLQRQLESDMLLDLLFNKTADGYWRLYRRGLINNTFNAGYQSSAEFAYARLGSECDNPEELITELSKLLFNEGEAYIQPEAVERLKNRTLGEYIASFEGFDSLAFDLATTENMGLSIGDFPEILQRISVASLKLRYAELFKREHLAVAIIEPN